VKPNTIRLAEVNMKALVLTGAALAATVALAACGGGGSSSSSGSSGSGSSTKTVSVKQVGSAGSVLVGSDGMALYASDQEMHGKVLCTGACTSFWKPLTVNGMPTGGSLSGKLGTVKRPDGKEQVTYQGKLLYSFAQDQPGTVNGDGASDAFGGRHFTWHVVHVGSTARSQSSGAAASSSNSPGY
jgi:predicted lipoprotein with Yx(FWY)xxD motif